MRVISIMLLMCPKEKPLILYTTFLFYEKKEDRFIYFYRGRIRALCIVKVELTCRLGISRICLVFQILYSFNSRCKRHIN